jgi:tetratricopeptide (TPR) repeat protein
LKELQPTPSSPNFEPLLQSALSHLNRGEVLQAENLLAPIASDTAASANVLQLMGVIRAAQGRMDDAEAFYRRSLAAQPEQPHVLHNLGNLLRALGRLDESVSVLREAVRLKSNYAEAHLSLALSLSAQGNHSDAEKSCRYALRIQPNYLLAKQALAAELNQLERSPEAERILRQALQLGVRDPAQAAALEHNLGIALNLERRYGEALVYFDAAQQKVPTIPLADYNRGNALQHLGRLEEAVSSYRRALASNPLNIAAHRDLNHLLYRLGDDVGFLSSYDEAFALYPEVGQFQLDKANFLFLQEKHELARECFERAASLLPQHPAPHDGLGLSLARLDNFDAAIREHEAAIALEPRNAKARRNFAETLLRAGDAPRALEVVEQALAIEPQDQYAIALLGVALRLLSDIREEQLNDCEKLVRVYEVAPPPGYASIEAFNVDLNTYLDRLHRDRRECVDQTLRRGSQTLDNLFGRGHAPVESLRAEIDKAVTDYISRMDDESDHALFCRRRNAFGYSASWSSRLHDCGFHTNHVHPKGWISSAYYVALPDAVERGDEGWIKFGEPNFVCGLKKPVHRTVQPASGCLVLFPSYMWHGTVPFHSAQDRTTIAFDVVPME